jgi:hypothetical protein
MNDLEFTKIEKEILPEPIKANVLIPKGFPLGN